MNDDSKSKISNAVPSQCIFGLQSGAKKDLLPPQMGVKKLMLSSVTYDLKIV